MTSNSLRETLRQLRESLSRSRAQLLRQARPPVSVLETVVKEIENARTTLVKCTAETPFEAFSEGEKLAVLRESHAVKVQLGTVARLVSGSAWFASLVKEMDGSARPQGLYGRDGAGAQGPAVSSVEHKI